MRLHHHFLVTSIIALVQTRLAFSQEDSSSSIQSCSFSCPPTNLVSWKLSKRPFTIGFDSFYSIFECVYATLHPTADDLVSEYKCSYYKNTGSQALEAAGDNCPLQAIPCPEPDSSPSSENVPMFSHLEEEEVVPWVEGGRYLLYLSEHPPS